MQEFMEHPPMALEIFVAPFRDNAFAFHAFECFIVLMLLDILFGFAAACKNGDVRSRKMRLGIWHKVGELGAVFLCDVLDGAMLSGVPLGYTAPITTVFVIYLIVMEGVSVFENLCKLSPSLAGSPLAKVLHEMSGSTVDSTATDADTTATGDVQDIVSSAKHMRGDDDE